MNHDNTYTRRNNANNSIEWMLKCEWSRMRSRWTVSLSIVISSPASAHQHNTHIAYSLLNCVHFSFYLFAAVNCLSVLPVCVWVSCVIRCIRWLNSLWLWLWLHSLSLSSTFHPIRFHSITSTFCDDVLNAFSFSLWYNTQRTIVLGDSLCWWYLY